MKEVVSCVTKPTTQSFADDVTGLWWWLADAAAASEVPNRHKNEEMTDHSEVWEPKCKPSVPSTHFVVCQLKRMNIVFFMSNDWITESLIVYYNSCFYSDGQMLILILTPNKRLHITYLCHLLLLICVFKVWISALTLLICVLYSLKILICAPKCHVGP